MSNRNALNKPCHSRVLIKSRSTIMKWTVLFHNWVTGLKTHKLHNVRSTAVYVSVLTLAQVNAISELSIGYLPVCWLFVSLSTVLGVRMLSTLGTTVAKPHIFIDSFVCTLLSKLF